MTLFEILAQYIQPIDEAIRNELFNRPVAYRNTMTAFNMSLSDVLALEPAIRNELLNRPGAYRNTMTAFNMSLSDVLALEPAIRNELLNRHGYYSHMMTAPIALIPLKAFISNELSNQYWMNTGAMSEARQTYQVLIINNIITNQKLLDCLLSQNPFLEIKQLVNESLIAFGLMPQRHQLQADNIADLVQVIKGAVEIRKNSQVIYQGMSNNSPIMFKKLPDCLLHKIAGMTGNNRSDETAIAIQHYRKPNT